LELKKFIQELNSNQKVLFFTLLAGLFALLWFALLSSFTEDKEENQTSVIEIETSLLDCSDKNKTSPLCEERRESLESLKILDELKLKLIELNAESWSKQKYTAILNLEEEGDTFFNEAFFGKSNKIYINAINESRSLINEASSLLNENILQGYRSLDNEDKISAENFFNNALMIFPQNQSALTGLARARVLEEVLRFKKEAELLIKTNSLDDAIATLKLASSLDNKNKEIFGLQEEVRELIQKRNLVSLIEEGYISLNKKDFSASRKAFNEAIELDEFSNAALTGLISVKESEKAEKIRLDRILAEKYFIAEDFTESSTVYTSLLVLEKNLGFALEGLDKVNKYIKVESQLDRYIERPKRVSSSAVYEEAKKFSSQITKYNFGERLSFKYKQLKEILNKYSNVINLQMSSDNKTYISIKNGEDLGTFLNKEIKLFAGTYTLIGKCKGYVTIRKEIDLVKDSSLFLSCREKI
jgi:hypothetical protein